MRYFLDRTQVKPERKADGAVKKLEEQCAILEDAAATLLKRGGLIARMYPEKSVKVYILVWNPVFDISRDRKADTVTGTGSYLFGNDVSSSYSGTGVDRFFGVRTDNAVSKDRRNRSSRLRCTAFLSFCNFVLPFVIGAVVVVLWRRVHRSTEKAA